MTAAGLALYGAGAFGLGGMFGRYCAWSLTDTWQQAERRALAHLNRRKRSDPGRHEEIGPNRTQLVA